MPPELYYNEETWYWSVYGYGTSVVRCRRVPCVVLTQNQSTVAQDHVNCEPNRHRENGERIKKKLSSVYSIVDVEKGA
jgi:hypothetical protein